MKIDQWICLNLWFSVVEIKSIYNKKVKIIGGWRRKYYDQILTLDWLINGAPPGPFIYLYVLTVT